MQRPGRTRTPASRPPLGRCPSNAILLLRAPSLRRRPSTLIRTAQGTYLEPGRRQTSAPGICRRELLREFPLLWCFEVGTLGLRKPFDESPRSQQRDSRPTTALPGRHHCPHARLIRPNLPTRPLSHITSHRVRSSCVDPRRPAGQRTDCEAATTVAHREAFRGAFEWALTGLQAPDLRSGSASMLPWPLHTESKGSI
jgi:hypothetical protein